MLAVESARQIGLEAMLAASTRDTFAGNLRRMLGDLKASGKGITQAELARRLSVHPRAVQQWLDGVIPNAETIDKLAEILGCTVQDFFRTSSPTVTIKAADLDLLLTELAKLRGFKLTKNEDR